MASNDKEILSCENKAINSVKSIIRLNSLREYQIEALTNVLKGKDCHLNMNINAARDFKRRIKN